jgi:hypothetical protein
MIDFMTTSLKSINESVNFPVSAKVGTYVQPRNQTAVAILVEVEEHAPPPITSDAIATRFNCFKTTL